MSKSLLFFIIISLFGIVGLSYVVASSHSSIENAIIAEPKRGVWMDVGGGLQEYYVPQRYTVCYRMNLSNNISCVKY